LRYLDETGFCLICYVPYGWQIKGEEICVDSQHSKRLNAVGIMNRSNELEVYLFEGYIDSAVLIACIDEFTKTIHQPTVIVMDKAPIHTSQIFAAKVEDWKQKQLEIFWLPSYSPQLNLIEILWRFIKYEWIEIGAYSSWESLVEYVEKVFRDFGKEYIINFA
jgi:transposase